jgi:hypothetical protein
MISLIVMARIKNNELLFIESSSTLQAEVLLTAHVLFSNKFLKEFRLFLELKIHLNSKQTGTGEARLMTVTALKVVLSIVLSMLVVQMSRAMLQAKF